MVRTYRGRIFHGRIARAVTIQIQQKEVEVE